jgi:hypothetical protein
LVARHPYPSQRTIFAALSAHAKAFDPVPLRRIVARVQRIQQGAKEHGDLDYKMQVAEKYIAKESYDRPFHCWRS